VTSRLVALSGDMSCIEPARTAQSLAPSSPSGRPAMKTLGITVYGCEQDEAEIFTELSPRFGVIPTLTSATPSETSAISMPRNRCISVGHRSGISGPTLRALKEAGVEYVSTRSRGLNHIDLHAAETLGITVENVAYAPDGVADYTLMLMLMAIRNAKPIVSSAERYDFRLGSVRGRELRDVTVGVVGAGQIGQAVITRLQGFGCRVLAHNTSHMVPEGAAYVPLTELLRESDIVTLHLPLTRDTHHIIAGEQIRMMKRGAVLINTGRGALVDTDALTIALESGRLAGAALDVIEGEEGLFYFDRTESPIDHPYLLRLQSLPSVLITPHTAYYTERVLYDTVEATLANCLTFARSRAI
jgi:D-specific alpha-keto acid dehydrogenase